MRNSYVTETKGSSSELLKNPFLTVGDEKDDKD